MEKLKKHEDEMNFFALELQSRRVRYGRWFGRWEAVSELKFLGHTIPIRPLKIPAKTITPRSRKLFGRAIALPPITMQAQTIELRRPAPGLSDAIAIALYGLLCDYGRSHVRPLLGLLVTAAAGALPFWAQLGLPQLWQAFGLSLANTFAVLGFRKELIEPALIERLPGVLKVFAGLQTGAGIVLLFLFGLALRNHFRMK